MRESKIAGLYISWMINFAQMLTSLNHSGPINLHYAQMETQQLTGSERENENQGLEFALVRLVG